jgi:membrane dipeptidase
LIDPDMFPAMSSWARVVVVAAVSLGIAGCSQRPVAEQPSLLERALRIQRAAPLIDGHNDLPWQLRTKGGSDFGQMDFRGALPMIHTDIPRLKRGGVGGVFFAAYVPYEAAERGIAASMTLEQIDLIHRMVEHAPELELAVTADDIVRIHQAGRIAALIGIEGGHAIEDSLPLLRQFYALGARYMTLTHNETISWADAGTGKPEHGGLTRFGEQVVGEMNRLGMLVDLSHVSDETMRDALRVSEAPVIFSHSSARALAGEQPRDVPDDVLRMVREKDGVVMVNFFSGFLLPAAHVPGRESSDAVRRRLREAFPTDEAARRAAWQRWTRENPMARGDIGTVANHIDHIARVAGIDHVGLGSDFDGVSLLPQGLEDVSCYPALTMELLRRGYTDGDVKKVIGGNVLRVMRACEATARRLRAKRGPSTARVEPGSLLRDQ